MADVAVIHSSPVMGLCGIVAFSILLIAMTFGMQKRNPTGWTRIILLAVDAALMAGFILSALLLGYEVVGTVAGLLAK